MWLSRRTFGLLALAAVTLAGCGYTPAYGPSGTARQLRVQVRMDAPNNRNEFDLVKQLELRLGKAKAPKYRLAYKIATTRDGVGVTPSQEIVRYNVFGKVRYTLTDIASGKVLTSGSTDTFTGYSVGSVNTAATPPDTSATISTLAAERDAFARLMVALADQIVTRLIATSPDWAQ
jgi:LPS-assembly lipoprotein